jgi:ribose 5-phosphate isomerase B
MPLRIAIASDHAAFDLKAALTDHLRAANHDVVDLGPPSTDSVDYPLFGYKLGDDIASAAHW